MDCKHCKTEIVKPLGLSHWEHLRPEYIDQNGCATGRAEPSGNDWYIFLRMLEETHPLSMSYVICNDFAQAARFQEKIREVTFNVESRSDQREVTVFAVFRARPFLSSIEPKYRSLIFFNNPADSIGFDLKHWSTNVIGTPTKPGFSTNPTKPAPLVGGKTETQIAEENAAKKKLRRKSIEAFRKLKESN